MAIPLRLPPALRYRDYRLFTLGYFPAETGEYIHFVAQNWLAWELTQSAFYLGLLGFFEFEECPPHLLGQAMSLFFLDRGFGSLGAITIGSLAALAPVPLAAAASALVSGLVAALLPKVVRARSGSD